MIDQIREWFHSRSREEQAALIGSLGAGAGTGIASSMTGGNVLLDTLLGVALGGVAGYGGTRAYDYFSGRTPIPSNQITPQQWGAVEQARAGSNPFSRGLGGAAGGGAVGLAGKSTVGRYLTGRDAFRSLLEKGTAVGPTDVAAQQSRMQKAYDTHARAGTAASKADFGLASHKMRDVLTQQQAGEHYGNMPRWRKWLAHAGIHPGMESAINKNVRAHGPGWSMSPPDAVKNTKALGKGFRNLLAGAAKGGKGRWGWWLGVPAAIGAGLGAESAFGDQS